MNNINKVTRKVIISIFLFISLFYTINNVEATTIMETTKLPTELDVIKEDSYIIGITKFYNVTMTGDRIVTATYNDSMFNWGKSEYKKPVIYFYVGNDIWYEFDENNKPIRVVDNQVKEKINNPPIYYVNNIEKMIEIKYPTNENIKVTTNKKEKDTLVKIQDNGTILVPSTVERLTITDSEGSKLDSYERINNEFKSLIKTNIEAVKELGEDVQVSNNKIIYSGVIPYHTKYDDNTGNTAGHFLGVKITEPQEYDGDIGNVEIIVTNGDKVEIKKISDLKNNIIWSKINSKNDNVKIEIKWDKDNIQEIILEMNNNVILESIPKGIISWDKYNTGKYDENTEMTINENITIFSGKINYYFLNQIDYIDVQNKTAGNWIGFTINVPDKYKNNLNQITYNIDGKEEKIEDEKDLTFYKKVVAGSEYEINVTWEEENIQNFIIKVSEDSEMMEMPTDILEPTFILNDDNWSNEDKIITIKYPTIEGIKLKYEYSIDNGETWLPLENGQDVVFTNNGILKTRVLDKTEVLKTSTLEISKIDKTAPDITFATNGNSTYAKTQISVVNITENESGIDVLKYKWSTSNTEDASNGIAFTNGDTLTTPEDLNGTYYLCIYARDNVGNDRNICSNAFMLDNTPPKISSVESTAHAATGKKIIITATDSSDSKLQYSFDGGNTWEDSPIKTEAADPTTPSAPVLGNLKPVVYDEENSTWKVVSSTDTSWYDYSNQKWANAVLLRSGITRNVGATVTVEGDNPDVVAMFVWIPRYEYKIEGRFGTHLNAYDVKVKDKAGNISEATYGAGTRYLPGEIEVKFIEKTKTTSDSGYIIHPAFWWDKNSNGVKDNGEQLDGIWVGKFETSHTTLSSKTTSNNLGCSNTSCTNASGLRILPSVTSLRYNNVSNFFYAARSMQSKLGITGFDSHMIKNSEWGAAAYLSQSKYGKYGNPNYSGAEKEVRINNCYSSSGSSFVFKTGIGANSQSEAKSETTCNTNTYETDNGMAASTTGNITGIYDMSGGTSEYVMGVYRGNDASSTWGATISSNVAGFTSVPESKYFDAYTTTDTTTACNGGICYGHALSETSVWYSDCGIPVESEYSWFVRGGGITYSASIIGVFAYSVDIGNPVDARGLVGFRVVLAHTT